VTWVSAKTSVATITSGGLATAVATGKSAISATLDGISGSTVLTVGSSSNDTSTTVTSSVNPSEFGQSVTFTAKVSSARFGLLKPTGTVEFFDGVTELGTGSLNKSGLATFTTSTLAVGSHSITAEYEGDSNFNGSTSAPLSQTVNLPSTSTRIESSRNPSVYGQSVTFTARVVSTQHGTPTGIVTFEDGSTILGTGRLTNGTASFTTSTLAVGKHTITAVYGGDTNFNGSSSAPLIQIVKPNSMNSIRLKSPDNRSVSGQPGTITANVTASLPGSGTTTGIVTIEDGSPIPGTLSGSTAKDTASKPTVGSHSIKAVYSGDGDVDASTSRILRQIVVGSSVQTSSGSTESTDLIDQVLGSVQDDSLAGMRAQELALEQVAFLSRRPRRSTDNT
jgi:Bacterial Ig-like domain (group 3)